MSTVKTIYVLGAGFSLPAGGPNQASLLNSVVTREHDKPAHKKRQTRLLKFLTDTMNLPAGELGGAILEDVYTPIDRCIARWRVVSRQIPDGVRGDSKGTRFSNRTRNQNGV